MMFPPPCSRCDIHRLSYNSSEPYGGGHGVYITLQGAIRCNGSKGREHAVDLTWSRNTRNHLRTLVLGSGLGLVSLKPLRGHATGNFTRANRERREEVIQRNATWRPPKKIRRREKMSCYSD